MTIILAIIGAAAVAGAIRALFAIFSAVSDAPADPETPETPAPAAPARKRGKRGGKRNRKGTGGPAAPAAPAPADPTPAAPASGEAPASPAADDSGETPAGTLPPFPWWDDRSCWGCEKSCKFRKFTPYTGNLGADIRGRARARAECAKAEWFGPVDLSELNEPHKGQNGVDPTSSKANLWAYLCEKCGEYVAAERASGRDPLADPAPAAPVEAEDCPF